jgi:hypothetical protein
MIGAIPIRLNSLVGVLATLMLGIAPASAWAECACASGSCGAGEPSGCCSTAQEQPAPKSCCEGVELLAAPAKCCCTSAIPRACSSGEQHRTSGDCECSLSRPPPAQNPQATSMAEWSVSDELPPWANAPLCFDLRSASSLSTNPFLSTPPIPFRELYCVWRI